MPSPSPPFTFYQLQMEIKEEATSSKLNFDAKQTNLSKQKCNTKQEDENVKRRRKNLNILESFPLVKPVKVIDLPH